MKNQVNKAFQKKLEFYKRKILFRTSRINENLSVINKVSTYHRIEASLLYAIISIENINRGSLITKFTENIITRYFKALAIKLDLSIGISQIKISTAKNFYPEISCYELVDKLMQKDFNIATCGKIIDSYKPKLNFNDTNELLRVIKLYTTGSDKSNTNLSIELYVSLTDWVFKNYDALIKEMKLK